MGALQHSYCLILSIFILSAYNYLGFTCRALQFQLGNSLGNSFVFQSNSTTDFPVAYWVNASTLRLSTLGQQFSVGRVMYDTPIKFINAKIGKVSSFSTYFSFQVLTTGHEYGTCGDGIAFFIAPNASIPVNGTGGGLGLSSVDADHITWANTDPSRHLLALEFDTYKNAANKDVSASHIGIDINGLTSSAVYNSNDSSSDLYLYKDSTIHAWLEYNASDNIIHVWATTRPKRPSLPIVTYPVDLSEIFHEKMYVGLTASTGAATQTVSVFAWNFSIE